MGTSFICGCLRRDRSWGSRFQGQQHFPISCNPGSCQGLQEAVGGHVSHKRGVGDTQCLLLLIGPRREGRLHLGPQGFRSSTELKHWSAPPIIWKSISQRWRWKFRRMAHGQGPPVSFSPQALREPGQLSAASCKCSPERPGADMLATG